MSSLRNLFVSCRAGLLAMVVMTFFAACETLDSGSPAGAPAAAGASNTSTNRMIKPDEIQNGEQLTIEFLDVGGLPPIQQTVLDDGTITLMFGQRFVATGKTTGALAREIRDFYVPKYYHRLTVNIKRDVRFVFVSGEVKLPARVPYTANMTVLKAIAAAQDFTVFANKKKVTVTRANGQTETVNCIKALKNPKLDLPIYPGDQINGPLSRY
jgi:protein involved in polysaccharide export with SLBB domain